MLIVRITHIMMERQFLKKRLKGWSRGPRPLKPKGGGTVFSFEYKKVKAGDSAKNEHGPRLQCLEYKKVKAGDGAKNEHGSRLQ